MSKTTLRKRIALTATTALFAGMLSFVAIPTASAAAGDTNLTAAAPQIVMTHLLVATQNSTTGASIVSSATDIASASLTARSLGLLSKDATTATAQTATVLAGGALSLYASVSTDVAFNATGGSFTGATVADKSVTGTYNQNSRSVFIDTTVGVTDGTATPVAIRWAAGTTPGTYTVGMNRSNATTQLSATEFGGTLTGQITVTVVAATSGGAYSAPYSACNTRSSSQGHGVATNIDTTSAIVNGTAGYIVFDADDAYDASLDSGAIVVSATGGALVSLANNGSTAAAGTTSTVVLSAAPTDKVIQVNQGTANAPLTTTVTVTYNGTTICTKTMSIRGEISKLEIANIGVGDLGANDSITAGTDSWIFRTLGDAARAGLFTVVGRDSAGNAVVTNAGGSFSADSATLTTQVTGLTVPETATNVSSTSATFGIYGIGTWTCSSTAGSSSVKLKWTNTGSGTVVTSDAFTAACADDPYTYSASFDKASYVQGELATLTVQFLDSKGNKANNVGAHGAMTTNSTPMLTVISSVSGTIANKNGGFRTYSYSVGTSTGITAGSYVASIAYSGLPLGTTQTPSYRVTTATTDVSNAEVLKSIVALIASINKQIAALQKLILQRR